MAFTSWAAELARWKDAIANRSTDAFWVMSTENSREMSTTYTKLNNITDFTEWLEMKAAAEAEGTDYGSSSIFLSVGGSA